MAALRQFQEENWYLSINSRLIIYQEAMGNKILALFLGLYLGFTFLLAAAAVDVYKRQVLKEARQAADGYLKQGRAWNRRLERLPGPVWGAAGALLASLGWTVWLLLL